MSIIFSSRHPAPRMNPFPLRLLMPLALLIVVGGCNSKADPVADATQPRPVLAARVEADGSQIENRRTYSVLKADGDGIITDVRVDRGQVVAEGQVVARLAHDGAREAIVNLPENQRDLASQIFR